MKMKSWTRVISIRIWRKWIDVSNKSNEEMTRKRRIFESDCKILGLRHYKSQDTTVRTVGANQTKNQKLENKQTNSLVLDIFFWAMTLKV